MTKEQIYNRLNTLYKQKYGYQNRDYSIYPETILHFRFEHNGEMITGYVFVSHEFNPGCYKYLDKIYVYFTKNKNIYPIMDVSGILNNYSVKPVSKLSKKLQFIYVDTNRGKYRIDIAYFYDMLFSNTVIGKTIAMPNDFSKFENMFFITPTSNNSFVFETKPEVTTLDMMKFPPFERLYKYFCVTHLCEGSSMYACQITFDNFTVNDYGGSRTLTDNTVWEKRDIIVDAYYRVVRDCPVCRKYAIRTVDKFHIKKM